MTLDEAIVHAQEISRANDCACAAEHRQLAEWLCELKMLREAMKPIMGCRTSPGKWMVKDDMTNKYFHIIRMAQAIMKGGAE